MGDLEKQKAALAHSLQAPDDVVTEQTLADELVESLEQSSAWAEMKLLEYAKIIDHRKQWSEWLLGLVCFITIMDFIVLLMLGADWINFDSEAVIPTFIGATLLEVFGLSYLVVQFLFNKEKNFKAK